MCNSDRLNQTCVRATESRDSVPAHPVDRPSFVFVGDELLSIVDKPIMVNKVNKVVMGIGCFEKGWIRLRDGLDPLHQ